MLYLFKYINLKSQNFYSYDFPKNDFIQVRFVDQEGERSCRLQQAWQQHIFPCMNEKVHIDVFKPHKNYLSMLF